MQISDSKMNRALNEFHLEKWITERRNGPEILKNVKYGIEYNRIMHE